MTEFDTCELQGSYDITCMLPSNTIPCSWHKNFKQNPWKCTWRVSFNFLHNKNGKKLDLYWILLTLFQQKTTENKESLENELAKVKKDRDLSMKKKDELTGILSQAAQALRTSLMVCCSVPVPHALLLPPRKVFDN